MGLDSDGMMRSVAYNVGTASGMIGHDPLGPDNAFEAAERAAAAAAAASTTPPTTSPTADAADSGPPGPLEPGGTPGFG